MSWFEQGEEIVKAAMAKDLDVSYFRLQEIYSIFSHYGFIDYDVEKEIFYAAVEAQ